MKLLYIVFLVSFATPTWADEEVNIRAWRSPDRLERWTRISQNMSLHNMLCIGARDVSFREESLAGAI